jgi:hypothetical protein
MLPEKPGFESWVDNSSSPYLSGTSGPGPLVERKLDLALPKLRQSCNAKRQVSWLEASVDPVNQP